MQRFDEKWTLDPETGCHVWRSSSSSRHYGRFFFEGGKWLAHRFAWEQEWGPIPDGLVIDHLCRNRSCVNVQHMELVTNKENILRGESAPAKNARKENCPRCGSKYTLQYDGSRKCMVCRQKNRKDTKRLGVGRAADRTHCPHGHPYDEVNTAFVRRADGSTKQRVCRECGRNSVRARRARQREVMPDEPRS